MISSKVVLKFPPELVDQPITSRLVKEHNLNFNILKAQISPKEDGLLVLELEGEKVDLEGGLAFLEKAGVKVSPLSLEIGRDEERCTDCSVCTGICPTGALIVDQVTRKVNFLEEKCIACEFCLKACPYQAMRVKFYS